MLIIRRYVPLVLRCIAIIGLISSLVVALLSLKSPTIEREYDVITRAYETTKVPNPFTIELAAGVLISSLCLFGFASVVEAADTYLGVYNDQDDSTEYEN